METIYQLRLQKPDQEPEIINTKIGKTGYSELKQEKNDLRGLHPDLTTKIWITPIPKKNGFINAPKESIIN